MTHVGSKHGIEGPQDDLYRKFAHPVLRRGDDFKRVRHSPRGRASSAKSTRGCVAGVMAADLLIYVDVAKVPIVKNMG